MNIKQLREEAKRLETEARAKLSALTDSSTPAEISAAEAEFDKLMDLRDNKAGLADRLERADAAERASESAAEARARHDAESRRPTAAEDRFAPEGATADEYREHFRTFMAAGCDIANVPEETRTALRRGLVEGRAQSGATNAAGGFTVPTTLASAINVAMAATGPMYDGNVTTEILTASGEPMVLPTVDDTENEASAHDTGDDLADDGSDDVVVGKSDLAAFTYSTAWIKWAFELAQDSGYSWEALLARLIGEKLGRTVNKQLTIGSGTGAPLGVVTGSVAGVTAAATSAVTFDEILDLIHSVDPAYRGGARVRFQMHDQSIKALRKIKDSEGRYIWSDGDVTRGVPASLKGYPVSFNQAMDTLAASKKPILFGDFGEYYVRKVGGPLIGVAREKFWPNSGIAGVVRVDGAVGTARAIKHLATPAS